MANPEHLETLRKGVVPWNTWRQSNPNIKPVLEDADLSGENLRYANLESTNLHRARLRKVDLRSATLTDANLEEVDLQRAYLRSAVLDCANLRRANIRGTDFTKARLVRADLSQAYLLGANFRGADLSEADFTGTRIWEAIFGNTKLSGAHLERCEHQGRSTIDFRTIELSGVLPLSFLRGCGLPDKLIEHLPSFLNEAVQYYSCFISYSSHDQEFAEQLHTDLQANGVRCWFAPEDLKIGDEFQERIKESIQLHDKLLLVLSENSMVSPWVEREVQAAFEREHRSKKLVLFPIRVDEAVMEATQVWAAAIRQARHIGEFGNWRDHNSYKKALERLLRDLKAETAAPSGT